MLHELRRGSHRAGGGLVEEDVRKRGVHRPGGTAGVEETDDIVAIGEGAGPELNLALAIPVCVVNIVAPIPFRFVPGRILVDGDNGRVRVDTQGLGRHGWDVCANDQR